ncbi:MAG: UDP-N-acetylmuramoyl-tripeptide--D-alanyl-D-alanine ligase, partial [Clostridia bacterium]|nr:UDP-N-acetylmuramoyl-tripeptide--D-alanyl-D-alanine ligase [Clostridia bacterium]
LDAIEKLEPVPHRMQLIHGNGIKIIDDSFNSNPDGARAAIETLSIFDGRRVVMTPGMVELGARESEENYKLGMSLGAVADLVLLVGMKRTDPIRRGLIDSGYGGEIHIYNSLKDAENDFANRLHVGDVLLILNDLPDIYDEKS